jgi:hypothetical protein
MAPENRRVVLDIRECSNLSCHDQAQVWQDGKPYCLSCADVAGDLLVPPGPGAKLDLTPRPVHVPVPKRPLKPPVLKLPALAPEPAPAKREIVVPVQVLAQYNEQRADVRESELERGGETEMDKVDLTKMVNCPKCKRPRALSRFTDHKGEVDCAYCKQAATMKAQGIVCGRKKGVVKAAPVAKAAEAPKKPAAPAAAAKAPEQAAAPSKDKVMETQDHCDTRCCSDGDAQADWAKRRLLESVAPLKPLVPGHVMSRLVHPAPASVLAAVSGVLRAVASLLELVDQGK